MRKHLEAIADFPPPTNRTDMRSYLALCEQVSYAFQVKTVLDPFCELLQEGKKFYWDHILQSLFKKSREIISNAESEGIKTFGMHKLTSLEQIGAKRAWDTGYDRSTVNAL